MKERGVVLGAGISGVGAALLAKKQGMDVFVSDASTIDTATKKLLDQYQIDWEETQHSIDKMQNVQWVVKSPGIPSNSPVLS
ncbi:MAG: UDP-N-acetylmuramoyl-L-alanine--D-glutamate ligase, partial [Flavobacteriaceae bacterium]